MTVDFDDKIASINDIIKAVEKPVTAQRLKNTENAKSKRKRAENYKRRNARKAFNFHCNLCRFNVRSNGAYDKSSFAKISFRQSKCSFVRVRSVFVMFAGMVH